MISRMERMRSLYRVIKSGQTVLGGRKGSCLSDARPQRRSGGKTANREPETAVPGPPMGPSPRYALISEEKKILEHARSQANSLPPGF